MKLLTFSKDTASSSRLGACIGGDAIIDMPLAYEQCWGTRAPDWFHSVADLLKGGDTAMNRARELLAHVEAKPGRYGACSLRADKIRFRSPAALDAKILCVTMNYLSHANASNSKPAEEPYFFIKMSQLMTGHRAPILLSRTSRKCDSEIELGVIIGRRGKYISQENAFDHVAGYTICNDFSFRDRRTLKGDPNTARLHWLTLKNLDTAAPIGPWLVTRDEIPDVYDLEISLTLENDPDERQTGSTRAMMHKIPMLIERASDGLTLEPGDVICTGTPHAVAFGHERYLEEGDVLRAEIQGIGALVNPVIRER
ncbi:MAG: fumarylacetoacetate hydrolase family protein [Gammaproteobacteria bacterium]|nr:fumarylacetoacetate hydrolase family protein [Gammaproteobacteria bacterium]